jgi:heme-degrading monooxygenase HmoA
MFVRVTQLAGDPSNLETSITNFKERIAPTLRMQPGHAGSFLLVNRESGGAVAGTYWDSLEAMNAAEQAGQDTRRQSASATSAEVVDVDRFEIFIADRNGAPTVPAFVRQTQIFAAPENADRGIEFIRNTVQPLVAGQPGYRSLIGGINRMTGRVFVSTNWDSAEARSASDSVVSTTRQQAAESAGATTARVETWEAVFVELAQPGGGVELRGVGEQARVPDESGGVAH